MTKAPPHSRGSTLAIGLIKIEFLGSPALAGIDLSLAVPERS